MATRSLRKLWINRSTLFSSQVMSLRPISDLSANKAIKHTEVESTLWTDKQHEEWVDRKFGQLKKRFAVIAKQDIGKTGHKKSTE